MSSPIEPIENCTCCGSPDFLAQPVLWKELIDQWQVAPREVAYIDRQQGLQCRRCGANLRAMTLAAAIMRCYAFDGLFEQFVQQPEFRDLRVLEVNEAAKLTQFLSKMPRHELRSYPDIDIMEMSLPDGSYDLVVHSDTLEHVNRPVRALSECFRVLAPGGFCAFTVPIVVDRLTRSRDGMPPSYHGDPSWRAGDFVVHTEYGADAWRHVVQAGFNECRVCALEYPSSVALVGVKWNQSNSSTSNPRRDATHNREQKYMHDLDFTGERLVPGKVDPSLWQEHMSRYMLAGEWVRGKRVLDAGCGAGYGADYLAALGAKSVLAVDISPDAIAFARDRYRQDNLEYRVASLAEPGTITGKFDVIVNFEVIEHLPDQDKFLDEVVKLLADGGIFITSTPDRTAYLHDTAVNPYHTREFDLREFEELLGGHFRRVQMFAQHFLGAIAMTPTNAAGDMVIDRALLKNTAYHRFFIAFCSNAADTPDVSSNVPRLIPMPSIDWQPQVQRAAGDLARVVPENAKVILVDQATCGPALAPGRTTLPFPEHDGQYWGPPADSDAAVRELERLREGGAQFIAFAWPAFWWLDFYMGLTKHLDARFRRVMDNQRLVIFDLREGAK